MRSRNGFSTTGREDDGGELSVLIQTASPFRPTKRQRQPSGFRPSGLILHFRRPQSKENETYPNEYRPQHTCRQQPWLDRGQANYPGSYRLFSLPCPYACTLAEGGASSNRRGTDRRTASGRIPRPPVRVKVLSCPRTWRAAEPLLSNKDRQPRCG